MLIKTAKGVRLVKKAREQAFPRVYLPDMIITRNNEKITLG